MINTMDLNLFGLETKWVIIGIAAIAVILALIVFIWIRVITKHSRYHKMILALDNTRNKINELQISFKLVKLEKIGANNVGYAELYNEYKQAYEGLVAEFNNDFNKNYDLLKKQLVEKDYKALTENIHATESKLINYRSKMEQLDAQISSVTKDEDELREIEAQLKSINRECYEKYQQHKENLVVLESEFKTSLNKIDDMFETYEEYISRGSYTDARENLMIIKENLSDLKGKLDDAPRYAVAITVDIPQKMNAVIDKYNSMQTEGYKLFHITANTTINSLKEKLKTAIAMLKVFDFVALDNCLEGMNKDIYRLDQSLDEEREAKEKFDSDYDKTYSEAEKLGKYYLKNIRDTADNHRKFAVDKEQDNLEHTLKVEIQKLSVCRNALDSSNYGNQSYTMRLRRLNELINQVAVVNNIMKSANDNITDKKDNAYNANKLVNEGSIRLKNLEIDVRNSHFDKIVQFFEDDFKTGYNILGRLSELVNSIPIDIPLVQKNTNDLTNLLNKLDIDTHNMIKDAEYAEKLLMFANSMRASSSSVSREVSKAELYFFDGKYKEAIYIIKDFAGNQLPKSLRNENI